jgi:hypothetical protein
MANPGKIMRHLTGMPEVEDSSITMKSRISIGLRGLIIKQLDDFLLNIM